MPKDFEDNYDISATQAQELLEDLGLNQVVDVHDVRDRAATQLNAGVSVRPAHVRVRDTVVAAGKAREMQRQSLTCVLDQPLLVGDVFSVSLQDDGLDGASSLAVCERCVLLDGPAFETRFRFVQEIELAGSAEPPRSDD